MPTHGAVEDYEDNQLVVALPHRDLVGQALRDLDIGFTVTDNSAPLGLALLTLDKDSLKKAADSQRGDSDFIASAEQLKWRDRKPEGTELTELDVLLSKLRKAFAHDYDGWFPDIGKNRMISPVRGLPYVSGCTTGRPEQLGIENPVPGLTDGNGVGWQEPRPTEPGQGVRVGLLDTHIYPNTWLQGGYLATKDDIIPDPPQGGEFQALEGHGTFIAGLILQQAPGAKLVVRPVLGGRALGKTWGVAKVMAEFAGTDVDILNLSFGCYTDDGQPPLVLAKAVSLLSPRILLVAAAGNHGDIEELRKRRDPAAAPWTVNLKDTTPVWPAAFAEVTAVGATYPDGDPAPFSPKAPWVDATAPGVDVESTYLKGRVLMPPPPKAEETRDTAEETTDTAEEILHFPGFARWRGTSFAAATVSGAVAARIGPDCDAQQALQAVLDSQNGMHAGIKRFSLSPVTAASSAT